VDHPLQAPDALVRPWRTALYIAVAIAAFELLLLLLIGGGKLAGWASHRMQLAAREQVAAPVVHKAKKTSPAAKPAAVTGSH